jgi:hypothetical protein
MANTFWDMPLLLSLALAICGRPGAVMFAGAAAVFNQTFTPSAALLVGCRVSMVIEKRNGRPIAPES